MTWKKYNIYNLFTSVKYLRLNNLKSFNCTVGGVELGGRKVKAF